jgi:hypothetical protein
MKKSFSLLAVSVLLITAGATPPCVHADAISPGVKDRGKNYSKEAPDASFYGTGIGGRMMEASMLRFEVDRLLQDGELDQAILKAKKAVQLDPADPECHMLLARALTRKFNSTKPIDERLLVETMAEWKMLWVHDADANDQSEAKRNTIRLMKIAHALANQHKLEEKARQDAKVALAQDRAAQAKESAPTKQAKTAEDAKEPKETQNKRSVAETLQAEPTPGSTDDLLAGDKKHKRFLLF